ncbi:MAG: ABC transporter ATP-binding protein [Oscillospiraceae bacterium]
MKNYLWALKQNFKTCPYLCASILILNILLGFLTPINLYLYKSIIFLINSKCYQVALLCVLSIVLLGIIESCTNAALSLQTKKVRHCISKKYNCKVFDSVYKTCLTNLDKSSYLTELKKALECVDNQLADQIITLSTLLAKIVTVTSVSFMVIQSGIHYFALFIIMSAIQNVFTHKSAKEAVTITTKQQDLMRKQAYFNNLQHAREVVKEVRTSGLFLWLDKKREYFFRAIKSNSIKYSNRWTTINILWAFVLFFIEGLFFYILIYAFRNNTTTIDQVVFLIQSQISMVSSVNALLQQFTQPMKSNVFIRPLRKLLCATENIPIKNLTNLTESKYLVSFQNVSFKYSNHTALSSINLNISPGENIAIVGLNGSGKSTFAKLIVGLLSPTSGIAFLNYNEKAVVFQDFAKFYLSIRENIALGNLCDLNNDKKIIEMLISAGGKEFLDNSSYGIETVLGKELYENGIDISGGQWQGLAFARALIKNAPLFVFDESCSSLDPLAEIEQFRLINKELSDKTVITISHRIGLAKYADKIVFLQNGVIKECGTPTELMQQKGLFFNLYNKQTKWYAMGDAKNE